MPPSGSQVGVDSAEYDDRPLTANEKKGLQFPSEKTLRSGKKQKLEPDPRHPVINPAVCIHHSLPGN
jgi:hypothetical protein